MKKYLSILTLIILLLACYSCNREKSAYTSAVKTNTLEALKEFAVYYPDGKYIDSAREVIDKLVWQSILNKNIICEFESFIEEHPKSRFIDSAKLMIEKLDPLKDDDNAAMDKDCNHYKTVKIGTQNWMAENLRTTRFNDGTAIPVETDNEKWSKLNTPSLGWYNNKEGENKYLHGGLYNWYAIETNKLCPKGWHVPTEKEWSVLIKFLGGNENAVVKMKSNEGGYWKENNEKSTSASGFTGLPDGLRDATGAFSNLGEYGAWWIAADSENPEFSSSIGLSSKALNIEKNVQKKNTGISVRCIEDTE